MFAIGSAVILHHPSLLLKNIRRAGRTHPLMGHSTLPFSKSVINSLLCSKVKYVNISGSTTSSFTYSNFSLTAEHDLPNCLVYVRLNTTCSSYMKTNIVSFWDLSANTVFKHTQDLSQANCFTGVCLYSKLRKQNDPMALSKFGCDTERCSVLLGRN